jgi:hypothetical protein
MSDMQKASIAQPHTASDAPPIHEQVTRAFRDQMRTLAPPRNPHEVFRAFVEMAALTIHQSPYHLGLVERDDAFDRIERAYLNAVQPYSPDELQRLVQLYGLAVLALPLFLPLTCWDESLWNSTSATRTSARTSRRRRSPAPWRR